MQVFLKCLDRSHSLEIDCEESIHVLNSQVRDIFGAELSLHYAGRLLEEGSIGDFGIESGSTIHAALPLDGGKRKRKKKVYTKPKKVKKVRKPVKLSILKYYKVEGEHVVRLRRECPSPQCGPGVFMAKMKDRSYCGRCGLTMRAETA
ncbi:hypothetical protein P9112_004331 [Eukaryota sp. TZLM1-RC]